jgi:hypothetical protein
LWPYCNRLRSYAHSRSSHGETFVRTCHLPGFDVSAAAFIEMPLLEEVTPYAATVAAAFVAGKVIGSLSGSPSMSAQDEYARVRATLEPRASIARLCAPTLRACARRRAHTAHLRFACGLRHGAVQNDAWAHRSYA